METSHDFLINFITKDQRYAVPSAPINVKSTSTADDLDQLVKLLISNQNTSNIDQEQLKNIEFDFIINGKLLRQTLEQFARDNEHVSNELQIDVEYFVRCEPPEPHKSLNHNDWISSIDVIDNWILSGCYDNMVHIWNILNGEHVLSLEAHQSPVKAVKWIRDTKKQPESSKEYRFITCSYDETAICWRWKPKSNEIEHCYTFIGHCRSIDCVDQHSDLIATGSYDQMLKIWSIADNDDDEENQMENIEDSAAKRGKNKLRSPTLTLEGHKESITSLKWLQDYDQQPSQQQSIPSIITVSLDQTMKIWDVEIGEPKQSYTSSKSFLNVAYSAANQLILTSSCDCYVRLWDLRESQGSLVKGLYSSHELWISSVDWSKTNTNQFVSGSYDNTVKMWDIRSTDQPLFDLIGHRNKVMALCWTESMTNGQRYVVSGGADGQIKIFSCTS